MKTFPSPMIGRTVLILVIIALLGLGFITLFYATRGILNGPFGILNDICVALGGILSGILAGMIYPVHRSYQTRSSKLAVLSAACGAFLIPLGSVLVIFNITGFLLAGLFTTFGYALIGLWLLLVSSSMLDWPGFSRKLAQFGRISAGVMIIGILALPGIITRTDSMDTAQWYVLAGLFIGGFGWNLLYTFWGIWLSRQLLQKEGV